MKTNESSEKSRRTDAKGNRLGRFRFAVPLGIIMTVLSIVGVVAIVFCGIRLGYRLSGIEQRNKEIYYFLQPVMAYNPTPFEDITETEQDAFLNAAGYRISRAEQIRMLRENDEICRYNVDDSGRIVVSLEEMEESYNALFGGESPLTHHTVSNDGIKFSDSDDCYYVPFNSLNAGYRAVIDSVKHWGKKYTVRVGYVALNDIKLDEHGEEIPPTASMATYYQTYTLIKTGSGYYISACTDE